MIIYPKDTYGKSIHIYNRDYVEMTVVELDVSANKLVLWDRYCEGYILVSCDDYIIESNATKRAILHKLLKRKGNKQNA